MSDLSLRAIESLEKEFGVRIYTDFDICSNTWSFAIFKNHEKIIVTEGPKFLSDSDIIVRMLRNKLTEYFIDHAETNNQIEMS